MIPLLRTPPWPGQPPRLVNELKLDRDKLLEWKKWTAPAKAYLRAKEPQFDLLPVIESYMNAASGFFNWFIEAINERNAEIKGEYQSAAQELMDWYQKETGITDEFMDGGRPTAPGQVPPNRGQRRGQRRQPKRRPKRKRQ
jgi:hypothetical protein